jgi:hypothetical protein
MLHELQRRNYSPSTIRTYLGAVQQFAEHFHCSPEHLGPEHLRRYQVFLLQEKKLEPSTVEIRISALRFLYKRTLRRRDLAYDELLFPKVPQKLPIVLSQEEVLRLIETAPNRLYLVLLYATGVRRTEAARIKVEDIDSKRMVIHRAFRYFDWFSNRMRARILPLCRTRPTRPLPPKYLLSRSPRYGVVRTAVGSCISSNGSRPPNSSLPNERSSMPLIPHRTWLSTAMLACFPAGPLLVRIKQSLPAARFPSARLHSSPSSAQSRMPSKELRRYRYPSSRTSALSQAIQTPHNRHSFARPPAASFKPLYPTCSAQASPPTPSSSCGAAPIEY